MTSPKGIPIITRFSDHSKYIISKITMNGGKIAYESHLHDSRKFKNARKMCPNRKIRTALTEQEIRILKNYPIEKIEEVTEPGTTDSEGTQVSVTLHQVQQN